MQVKRENRTLHLSDFPTNMGEAIVRSTAAETPSLAVSISYTDHSCASNGIVLDNVVIPLIEEALRQDPPTDWKEKVEEQAQDVILNHEDDLVENLARGYVTDPPTRAAITRRIDETRDDQVGCAGVSLKEAAELLDQLGEHAPCEWLADVADPRDAVVRHANETFTLALRSRVDAMLDDMEDVDLDDPTEDDFRNVVQEAAGYEKS